jgi:hypothetical protein
MVGACENNNLLIFYLRNSYQEEVEDTKEQSKSVNRRRSDNTMAKRKGQTTINKTYTYN